MITHGIALLSAEGGGFNPLDLSHGGGLFWTVVIFLAALWPIWKLVMGPIAQALESRDERVSAAIRAAEEASRKAQEAEVAVSSRLAQAQREAGQLLEGARARAEVLERALKDQAGREAAQLLERAKSEIRAEQDKALAAIRKEVVQVALDAASQVLRRRVDSSDDRRLVEELVAGAARQRAT